ncbi:MAG TPA: bile acid:sodium symporter family protein [Nevskiaceae bacterium]|nr:bile acid:sodium symporter family protein [Nevskiaceae bacterium]
MNEFVRYFFLVGLGTIMLGVGLSLTMEDFKRVLVHPRAVVVALVCQAFLMPFVCLGVAHLFDLAPELAVGLMLLAATPGGTVANLYSHIARGDVALNITLTAVNSVLCMFTLPFIVNLSMLHFMGEDRAVPMDPSKIREVFMIVIGPAAAGMSVRWMWKELADRAEKPVKILSGFFLLAMIALIGAMSHEKVLDHGVAVGGAVFVFSALSIAAGYFAGRLIRVRESQAIAMGMEIGIHNAALAITIGFTILGNPVIAVTPTVYGVVMLFTAALFGWLVNLRRRPDHVPSPVTSG